MVSPIANGGWVHRITGHSPRGRGAGELLLVLLSTSQLLLQLLEGDTLASMPVVSEATP
jgi:hypothetical protein